MRQGRCFVFCVVFRANVVVALLKLLAFRTFLLWAFGGESPLVGPVSSQAIGAVVCAAPRVFFDASCFCASRAGSDVACCVLPGLRPFACGFLAVSASLAGEGLVIPTGPCSRGSLPLLPSTRGSSSWELGVGQVAEAAVAPCAVSSSESECCELLYLSELRVVLCKFSGSMGGDANFGVPGGGPGGQVVTLFIRSKSYASILVENQYIKPLHRIFLRWFGSQMETYVHPSLKPSEASLNC
ncbi:hypothetical protein Taro_056453 [Colocasia esculenta]|uniref:Uncharacterized protein n=1 Tax=Colocasia esculenta TaxID=4460 RepID=A0A843XTZ5_COLES|nr:hypothetical protein [Colocasia esculenta]